MNCWARRQARAFAPAVFAAAMLAAPASHAQISKANQILINRGLQVEGMVFHFSRASFRLVLCTATCGHDEASEDTID